MPGTVCNAQYNSTSQRMVQAMIVVLVLGMARISNQCSSKNTGVEEYQVPGINKHQQFRREKQLSNPPGGQKSLFKPPQQILYGFSPIPVEGREDTQAEPKTHQQVEEGTHDKIELLNIPGPPYDYNRDKAEPQKLLSESAFDNNIFPENVRTVQSSKVVNIIKGKTSKQKVQRNKPVNNQLHSIEDEEGFRRNVNFYTLQGFPKFESFHIDFVPGKSGD